MRRDKKNERAERAIAFTLPLLQVSVCRPLSRALSFVHLIDPGVALRSTPGFMLPPRFAGSMKLSPKLCSRLVARVDEIFNEISVLQIVKLQSTPSVDVLVFRLTHHFETRLECDAY